MAFDLAKRVKAGDTLYLSWHLLKEPALIEIAGRSFFDAVVIDMQHGYHDLDSLYHGISAATLADVPAIVRLDADAYAIGGKALDMGAQMVIAPMINTVKEAQALVQATRYPPIGARSWGPVRTTQLQDNRDLSDYLEHGNAETLVLVMLETKEALANMKDILAVDGIDGIYIGPGDLSIALAEGDKVEAYGAESMPVIDEMFAAAKAAGKVMGGFTFDASQAKLLTDRGAQLVSIGVDYGVAAAGFEALNPKASS